MSNFNKYNNKGLTGLSNLGNTCFLNTAIQCLSHTYEFNEYLDTNSYKNHMNKKIDIILLKEYDELRKLMWSENCKISPSKFVNIVQKISKIKGRDLFTGFAQNDLPEFLYFIFECFHNGTSREVDMEIKGNIKNKEDTLAIKCYEMMRNMYSKEYSDILRLFYGISVSTFRNYELKGKKKYNIDKEDNYIPEPYLMLDLPMVKKEIITLKDCLDEYTKEDEIDEEDNDDEVEVEDEEDYDNIKKIKTGEIKFWSLPEIMIISLKRFNGNLRKNQNIVNFELENLDMSKYVCGYNKEKYVYDLYGICNHTGNVMGGHYYAYIKNNNKWYKMNDINVEEISINNIISNYAYCLFYRKKKSV
jgi:ubiquitin carboxyl-terminal hydrolase 8